MAIDAGKRDWESRVREIGSQVEDELRRFSAYLNDEVVPDVRRNSSSALRSAAAELTRLAERMEDRHGAPPPPPAAAGEPRR